MSDVVINSITLEQWKGQTSDIELRLTVDIPFTTPQGEQFGANEFVSRAACSISSSVIAGLTQYSLTIPQITIPATTDALVGRAARYSANFHKTSTGAKIQAWSGFDSFAVQASPSTQSWKEIQVYNFGGTIPSPDTRTFTRSEIMSILGAYVPFLSGWSVPLPTPLRTALPSYVAPVISNPPTQAEVQALAAQVEALSARLAALILDVKQ